MDKDSKSGSSAKNTSESSTSTVIAEQSIDTSSKVASKDAQSERKAKPPPLDVTAAQELQQQAMAGPKTPTSASPVTPGVMPDHRKVKKRKIGHRRVNEEGQITFKKIETSQIMGSIQLGISCSISALASKPERDLLIQDFSLVETKTFPKNGSNFTPAHRYNEFTFKTYSPVAFRYFRHLFGIEPVDFLLSLCNNPLIELTNPGASGSIFYLTEDDEFIIKTVQHKEAEFLTKLLPGYYMNLNQNPRTLLPKFYGLFCYQCIGKNVRLIVMNNLLPSFITLHEKYDLKGSTYKRKASKNERKKSSPTYKDLDFIERHPEGILMEAETYHALIRTITRDCRVLESFKIMDYSLLVGVHNVDLAKREKKERRQKREADGKVSDESDSASPYQIPPEKADASLVRSKSINKPRLANYSTAMESIQAEAEMLDEDEDMPPGGIPAKNAKGDNLLLFIGIIDILQSYHLKKKLEHTFKSMLHDGDTVSVHRPGFYAQRFLQFMSNTVFKKTSSALKHVPSKRKATSSKKVPASGNCDPSQLSRNPSASESPPDIAIALPVAETGSSSVAVDFKGSSSPSSSRERQPSGGYADPVPPRVLSLRSSTVSVQKTSVSADKMEIVRSNLYQLEVQSQSVGDGVSEVVSSVASGVGSSVHAYTPPYSIEGSTPTYTEGTPSFTESSLSGDTACPTTPVQIVKKSMDSLLSPGESQL